MVLKLGKANFREWFHWALTERPWLRVALSPILSKLRIAGLKVQYWQIRAKSNRVKLRQLSAPLTLRERKVVVVMSVRNEMALIPACLLHYRELGISEFHIVDNCSVDGTKEYLLDQPDVSLYATDQSYREAYYGITWINNITNRFQDDRWVLFVDADELLYYEKMESKDIHEFSCELEARGQSYLYAPLVDLYGLGEEIAAGECSRTHILRMMRAASHDIEGYKQGRTLSNGFCELVGGPRGRISAQTGSHPPLLTKYPLIKCLRSRYFTASSHEFMPQANEAHSVAGWLVHLKLGGMLAARHADPAIEREHYGGGVERRFLVGEEASDAIFADHSASRFDGIESLKKIGIHIPCKQ